MSVLIAFEASARHSSFTKAAEELALTQSAVSRQVQALEAQLEVALFRREGRHIELTAAGALYHHELAIAEDSEHVGYDSASTFSTALSRHVGQAPGQYQKSTRQRSVPGTSSRRASAMSE